MKIGVLCGGGPAPGFNGVIHGVTVAARRRGWTVVGIPDGYKHLMAGDTAPCRELTEADVAGISTRGGGILRTNRANPKKSPETMDNVVAAVKDLGLDALVTIGGDDTATSAANVADAVPGLRVAHVPKTIDNDLPLPGMAPTFGYTTAADLGARLCRNLRTDALTTSRWYLVTAMGRSAGHLSLSMAAGSEADLCIVREEFEEQDHVVLDELAALVEEAIQLRAGRGQAGGLVVLAEGILERLDPGELAALGGLELDEHGNPRMSEIDLGRLVRDRLVARGTDTAFVTKLIGYELRCADPVAFDVEYTTNLGAAAIRFLADGDGHGIMAIDDGAATVLRFQDLRDETGRIPVRRLDLHGAAWQGNLAMQARK